MIFTKTDALLSLCKNAKWYVVGDEITWNDEVVKQPSNQEIADEIARLTEEYAKKEYARKRKTEYDQLNQFELMYDDFKNGTNNWLAAIENIKQKYPKD